MPILELAISAHKAKQGAKEFNSAANSTKESSKAASRYLRDFQGNMDVTKRVALEARKAILELAAAFGAIAALRHLKSTLFGFETGLIGVAKTTNIAGDELDRMADRFVGMSLRIPVAGDELLSIGQAAGQLGVVGSKNILLFTDTIAKLDKATNLHGSDAATILARMLNVTDENMDQVAKLASVIVALGNTSAATESEIAHTATIVAQSTAVYDVSSAHAAAMGAALSEMGVQARLGGSAVGRAFRAIDAAVRAGGERLDQLAALTGKTGDEIKKIFQQDSVHAFQLFVEGLEEVIEQGGDVTEMLKAFGLEGDEILKVLPTIAKRSDLLAKALKTANAELEHTTALETEVARAFGTAASAEQHVANVLDAVILKYKESTGSIADFLNFIADVIAVLGGIDDQLENVSTTAVVVAKAIEFIVKAAIVLIGLKMAAYFWSLVRAIESVQFALFALKYALLSNPLTTLAVIIAGVTAAVWTFADSLGSSSDAMDENKDAAEQLANSLQNVENNYGRLIRAKERGDLAMKKMAIEDQIAALQRAADSIAGNIEKASRNYDLTPMLPTEEVERALYFSEEALAQFKKDRQKAKEEMDRYVEMQAESAKRIGDPSMPLYRPDDPTKVISAIEAKTYIESEIDRLNKQLEELDEKIKIATEAKKKMAEQNILSDEDIKKIENLRGDLDRLIESLQADRKFASLLPEDRAIEEQVLKAQQMIDKTKMAADERERYLKTVREETVLTSRANAATNLANSIRDIQREIDVAGQSNALHERAIAIRQAEEQANRAYGRGTREATAALMGFIGAYDQLHQMQNDYTLEQSLTELRQQAEIIKEGIKASSDLERQMIEEYMRSQFQAKSLGDQLYGEGTYQAAKAASLYLQQADTNQRLQSAAQLKEMVQDLDNERRLIGLTNEERERAIQLARAQALAERAFGKGTKEATDAVGEFDQALRNLEEAQELENVAKGIGDAFSDAFMDMVTGAKTATDAIKSLVYTVAELVLQQSIADKLAGAITGGINSLVAGIFSPSTTTTGGAIGGDLPSYGPTYGGVYAAHGMAFDASGIIPFAHGGIVDSPTLFKFAQGTGLMGEAGPEAIMPLARDSQGNLGVKGSGGGSNVYINIVNNSGEKVKTHETTGANGERRVDVIVGEAMARDIKKRGPLAKSIEDTYGIRRAGR